MSSNPALYRYIDFIGGNILDASNVTLLQTELQGLGSQGLGQLYEQGALLNAIFNITGSTIVFTHANTSYPIYVFVNGQFESLGNTVTITGSQPVSGAANQLYLNWSWDIKTSTDDSTFVDGTTGQSTIETGQLSLAASWTDTSGTSLNPSTQFAKNTSPIILATFNMSGSPVTVTYINGVYPYAMGNKNQAGLVSLTDNTGIAVGTTDPRLNFSVGAGTVYDYMIASLISSGTNASGLPAWQANFNYAVSTQIVDSNNNVQVVVAVWGTGTSGSLAPTWNTTIAGQTFDNPGGNQIAWFNLGTASTTKYDPATSNQGGIFSDHIIYTTLKEKLTTFLDGVNTAIETTLLTLRNHVGNALGTPETHPFPTAAQVGAAPASHVGQVLGLSTSHPAQVNSDHSGFIVQRNPSVTPASTDYAYQLTDGTNNIASINHSGDMYANIGSYFNAQGSNGQGNPANYRGLVNTWGQIAAILSEHVNYNTHGNNNPHNLDPGDIGAASTAYVDTSAANTLSAADAFTLANVFQPSISTQIVDTTGGSLPTFLPFTSTNFSQSQYVGAAGQYVIVSFLNGSGHGTIIGIGSGWTSNGTTIPLPSGFPSGNWIGDVSAMYVDNSGSGWGGIQFTIDNTRTAYCTYAHSTGLVNPFWGSWNIICWNTV
jgi:hypothetical protein